MLKLQVEHQRIEPLGRELLADGQIAFVEMCFCFSDDWEALDKVAQFTQSETTYNVHLGKETVCTCTLPSELTEGEAQVSIFGYGANQAVRGTTVPLSLFLKRSGFVADGTDTIPPTPDLYAQLLEQIDAKIASVHDGADGKSAYEIAVENGYTGTETEWLASLKGEKGDTGETGAAGADGKDGTDGKDGAAGADGKSAYAIAVENGYIGTETEWLASLKGEKGDSGEQGLQGEKGEKGDTGETGAAGADGADGKDGADGFSPAASVTKADGVATITITDKDGTTTATVSDGETPDISNVENTVEALAAGLSDSGWVQLEESAFTSDNKIDTENSKVYYRKIGAIVNLCGRIVLTAVPAISQLFMLPSTILPLTNVSFYAHIAGDASSGGFVNVHGAFFCTAESSFYFNTTYMTNDTPTDVSSLLAALADLVEVE